MESFLNTLHRCGFSPYPGRRSAVGELTREEFSDMTNPDVDASPGYEPVDRADVERVRAALDTTSTDGTDTEVALPPAGLQRSGGDYLIRSEEHLQVGTEKVATGRVFLRKYVVTEEKTITVSVSHEEVEMIREPIAPGTNLDDLTVTDGATEVILTEERIVISKEIVPVERVRLTIETIPSTGDRAVPAQMLATRITVNPREFRSTRVSNVVPT